MTVAARLAELNITLPEPAKAVANYVGWVRTGNLVHISGQLSNDASGGIKGTVGDDVTPEQALAAARLCGINLLAQLSDALDGDLERVVRVVKLGGFVQAAGDFSAIPAVINGCSDLMVEVLGDKGRHARAAVGVYRLPLGFAVEVDAVVEVS
ncbi:RidA family protein [Brevundimonas sp.]